MCGIISSCLTQFYDLNSYHVYVGNVPADALQTILFSDEGDNKLTHHVRLLYQDCKGVILNTLNHHALSLEDISARTLLELPKEAQIFESHLFSSDEYFGLSHNYSHGKCSACRQPLDFKKLLHLMKLNTFLECFAKVKDLGASLKASTDSLKKEETTEPYVILDYSSHPLRPKIKTILDHCLIRAPLTVLSFIHWVVYKTSCLIPPVIRIIMHVALTYINLYVLYILYSNLPLLLIGIASTPIVLSVILCQFVDDVPNALPIKTTMDKVYYFAKKIISYIQPTYRPYEIWQGALGRSRLQMLR